MMIHDAQSDSDSEGGPVGKEETMAGGTGGRDASTPCRSLLSSFREIEARWPVPAVAPAPAGPQPALLRHQARHATPAVSTPRLVVSCFPEGDPPWKRSPIASLPHTWSASSHASPRPISDSTPSTSPRSSVISESTQYAIVAAARAQAEPCVQVEGRMLTDAEGRDEVRENGDTTAATADLRMRTEADTMGERLEKGLVSGKKRMVTDHVCRDSQSEPDAAATARHAALESIPADGNGETERTNSLQYPALEDADNVCLDLDAKLASLQSGMLLVELSLSGENLPAGSSVADTQVGLVFLQKGREVGRSFTSNSNTSTVWNAIHLRLRKDVTVHVQCWARNEVSGNECMVGETRVRTWDILKVGAHLALKFEGGACGTIKIRDVTHVTEAVEEDCSVVCFLQEKIFHREGADPDQLDPTDRSSHSSSSYARFYIFRVHNLNQRLGVKYKTVSVGGQAGDAVQDDHYTKTSGVTFFEEGSSLSYFDVQVSNDDTWEPIREFDVLIEDVVEGKGMIGVLDACTCIIVDDDLYPYKWVRDEEVHPIRSSERILPSCSGVHKYLTVDEVSDFDLIHRFFIERVRSLWPFSKWAFIWSCYRALYHVTMALVLILFIDNVWSEPESADAAASPVTSNTTAAQRITLAVVLSLVVAVMTVIQSCTETWIVVNCKCGLTGKQLRDWIVAQLLWADDGRLSMMRAADYLNAATTEVRVNMSSASMICTLRAECSSAVARVFGTCR